MSKNRDFQSHWEELCEWFDFDKVSKLMNTLDWKWASLPNYESKVPTTAEIVNKAREHCLKAYNNSYTISSGGFEAKYDKEEDCLTLRFVAESWRTLLEDSDGD